MLLHETKKVIASQLIVAEVTQSNSIQSAAIQSKTYLQVFPVVLSNDSYSVRTRALLEREQILLLSEKTLLKSYT